MWTRTLLGLSPLLLLSALPASPQRKPLPPQPLEVAPAQDLQQNLADIVPADAFLAIHLNDPAGMIAEGKDSSFVQMFMDPRWVHLLESESDHAETAEKGLETFHKALSGVSEMVFWLDVSDYESVDDPVFYGMLHGTTDSLDALQGLLPDLQEVESWNGMTLYGSEDVMVLRDRQWCGVMSGGDDETAREILEGFRDRAHQDEVEPGFFAMEGLAAERSGAHFEMGLHLAPWWDEVIADAGDEMPAVLHRDFKAMSWIYASGHLGTGNTSDWELVFPMAEDGFVAELLNLVEAPTREDFARIPKAATTLSVGSFDLQGFIDMLIEMLGEFTPDPESEWEAMLEQGSQMIGVDLQADFLDQVEGTMIAFGLPDSTIEIDDLVGSGMTYIFDVHDSRAVTKTLEGLFGFLGMAGLGEDMVDEEEATWGQSWLVNIEDTVELVIGCDSSSLIFSVDPAGVDAYQELKSEPDPDQSVLANEGLQNILSAFDELPMQAADTEWSLRVATELIIGLAEAEEDPDMVEIAEFLEYALDIATDHLGGWSGYTMETTSDRARLLFKTR